MSFGGMAGPAASAPGPEELAGYPFNDFGNARRLQRLVGATIEADGSLDLAACTLLYLREVGWIAFNGRFWDRKAGENLARRIAHQVADKVRGLGEFATERGMTAAAFWKFADSCGQAGSTNAMLKQAECYLTVDFDAFDRDPLALNVANGVLRFRRAGDGKVETAFTAGHRASDRFTRIAEVAFDKAAAAPVWAATMAVWQPVEATRSFLQRVMGYAATGCTHEQLFVILHGLGRDGKSTMIGVLRELLGSYACSAGIETFLDAGAKRGGDASADIARLAGDTRFVSTAEPPRGAKLADNVLKSFTGGAPLAARQLHKDFFEFTPVGKVVMECNLLPAPQGSDDGIWRRLTLIPFRNQIREGSEDKALPGKLRAEMPGVLNWIIEGIEGWLRAGLNKPDEVLEALSSYRKASSPFGEWIMDRLIIDKEAKILASELYGDFKAWMADQGHEDRQVMTQRAFGSALNDRQIILAGKDGTGKKMRSGARLRDKFGRDEAGGEGFAGGAGGPSLLADTEDWGGS